jgi:hypothetical protein
MKEWHYSVAIRAWPLSLSPEGEVCVLGFAVFSTPSADVGGGRSGTTDGHRLSVLHIRLSQ